MHPPVKARQKLVSGVHKSDLLRWINVRYVCGKLYGTIRKARTTCGSLALTNAESAATDDKDRSRGLYSVMGCPQPILRFRLGTVMLVLQQEALLRVIWRLELRVSSGGCVEQGELTPGPMDRLGDQMFIGAGRWEPSAYTR